MSTTAPPLQGGVITALLTPLDRRGTVDERGLDTLVDFQIDAGVDGLFILGTSGEGMLLPPSDRRNVVERVLDRAGDRLPIVVHCGAADTDTASNLVRHAADTGVRSVAAIPPLFFPYGDDGVFEHFSRLADAAPEIDHYLYENPARTGYAMSTSLVHRLFTHIEPIRGVKDTGDSVGRMSVYLAADPEIRVYAGNNTVVLGALATGAVGAVSTTANIVPELFVKLISAFNNGDMTAARELQRNATQIQQALAGLPYIAAAKYLSELRGLPGGHPHSPLPQLSDAQRADLRERAAVESIQQWLAPLR